MWVNTTILRNVFAICGKDFYVAPPIDILHITRSSWSYWCRPEKPAIFTCFFVLLFFTAFKALRPSSPVGHPVEVFEGFYWKFMFHHVQKIGFALVVFIEYKRKHSWGCSFALWWRHDVIFAETLVMLSRPFSVPPSGISGCSEFCQNTHVNTFIIPS